nr:MAG TPA: hypothetical protein [Caudoviricetes sp.]
MCKCKRVYLFAFYLQLFCVFSAKLQKKRRKVR